MLFVIEEIYAQTAAFDEERLLSVGNRTRNWIVKMGVDQLAGGMVHVCQLLRQVVGREEADAGL